MSTQKNYILDEQTARNKLKRLSLEILENNAGETSLLIAGVRENGVVIAECIADMLSELSSIHTELITISLDKKNPGSIGINKTPDFNDKVIIIADDVSNTGRTLLYALKPFLGAHPRKIQTLVLVERAHTSFPVRPDYVGLSLATTLQETIVVEVNGKRVTGAYLQ